MVSPLGKVMQFSEVQRQQETEEGSKKHCEMGLGKRSGETCSLLFSQKVWFPYVFQFDVWVMK